MTRPTRRWPVATALTSALVLLVGFAGTRRGDHVFTTVLVAMVLGGVGFLHLVFPRSRLFSLALASALAVYASMFIFFLETNFAPVEDWAVRTGFVLPIVAFLLGAWARRPAIERVLAMDRESETRELPRALLWLVPVFAIGAATFLLPGRGLAVGAYDAWFLAAMAAIAAVVVLASRDVAVFLIDSGLLFEEFFARVGRLIMPAFAFLTFYSLIVVVFASAYRIVDLASGAANFRVDGELRPISFPESLYFSIVTLSTVGYGDILPASNVVRVLVAVQMVAGVLLLLFGFSEILDYAREHRRGGRRPRDTE